MYITRDIDHYFIVCYFMGIWRFRLEAQDVWFSAKLREFDSRNRY